MAKVLIDLDDTAMLEWATIICEATGAKPPEDVDDSVCVVYDAIMNDRRRLCEHIYDKRARAVALDAAKAQMAAVTIPPTRKLKVEEKI
jgi:hypothetical protein